MISKLASSTGLLSATVLFSSTAMAAASTYVGINHTSLEYDARGVPNGDLSAVVVRIGRQYNPYISSEFRLGTGIGDETIAGINLELDSLTGGFLRAGYPVSSSFYPYAVAGYSNIGLTASAFGLSASEVGTDISFGAGFDFNFNKRLSLNAEYMNYHTRDLVDIESYSVGLSYRF